jgi:hypothetical protein
MIAHGRPVCLCLSGLLTLIGTTRALGIVQTIDGDVTAEVNEFVNGSAGDSDFAFKALSETTQTLPLDVVANLAHFDSGEPPTQDAGARAQTIFSDPRISTTPDPEEFGINLAAFSRAAQIAYSGQSLATETRSIDFLSVEIGARDGTPLEAQSQFFLDGVILVWGEPSQTNLAGTQSSFSLNVVQSGDDLEAPLTVLEAGLTLTGAADGSATLTASGRLSADNVVVVNLTGQVPQLGPVHLIVIPQSSIPYTYNAKVGNSFTLKASIQAQIKNQPFTGAAVVLGVPLSELAGEVDSITGGQVGGVLEQLVQAAIASSGQPASPLPANAKGTTVTVLSGTGNPVAPPSCGLFGMESMLAMSGFSLVGLSRRRLRSSC